jgi:spermidine synthase
MLGEKKYDVIEADALRPTSAYSGNLYSEEYFTLLKENLKPGGYAVSWAPTDRVADTFIKVFPFAVRLGGFVLIGSNEPINVDIQSAKERLASDFSRSYYAQTNITLERFQQALDTYDMVEFTPAFDRSKLRNTNTDLFPKDEYLVP